MNTFARTIKRSVVALALVGAVSAAALGSGVAHAGPAPQIAVQVQLPNKALVTGYGFGPGDPVEVVVLNNDGNTLVTWAETTASARGRCILHGGCFSGFISVTASYAPIHCGYEFVSIYAVDLTTGATSNVVSAQLGEGAC